MSGWTVARVGWASSSLWVLGLSALFGGVAIAVVAIVIEDRWSTQKHAGLDHGLVEEMRGVLDAVLRDSWQSRVSTLLPELDRLAGGRAVLIEARPGPGRASALLRFHEGTVLALDGVGPAAVRRLSALCLLGEVAVVGYRVVAGEIRLNFDAGGRFVLLASALIGRPQPA